MSAAWSLAHGDAALGSIRDARAVWFAAGCAVGVTLLAIAIAPYTVAWNVGGDLASYVEVMRMVAAGRSPYDAGAYCGWLAETGSSVGCEGNPGLLPAAMFLLPWFVLPWPFVLASLTAAGVLAGATGLYRALVGAKVTTGPAYALAGFACFASVAAMGSIADGQWGHLLLASWCWRFGGPILSLVKPQIAGGMAVAVWTSWSDRRRIVAAAIAIAAVGLTLQLWAAWAVGLMGETWPRGSASAWRVLGPLAGIVGVGIAIALRRSWLVAPVAWHAGAPYTQSYDMVWLIGPLLVALARWGGGAVALGVVGFVIAGEVLRAIAREGERQMRAGVRPDEATWSLLVWGVLVVTLVASRGDVPAGGSAAAGTSGRSRR